MLNENEVIGAVCSHLKEDGYTITQQLRTTERGTDVIAEHPSQPKLHIEAKGGTSARQGSARYGRPYNLSQVFDRVAKGFYTAVDLYCDHREHGDQIGLAFPDTEHFRKYLMPITPVLRKLGISVYMVSPHGRVMMLAENPWRRKPKPRSSRGTRRS